MSYSDFQGRFGQGQEHAREQALSEGGFTVLIKHAVSHHDEHTLRE
jgi:hypothetical protein